MSVAGIGSSPILQWLQTALSSAGSATGSPPSCGCQSSSTDTASISQQAVQLNANQTSQAADPSQTSGVYGPQGHHHRHHHRADGHGGGSSIDQLAQSIVTDLQKATGSGASVGSGSSTTGSASTSATGGSFIDKLASEIANDLLAQYQQATGLTSQSSTTNQVNVTA